MDLTGEQKLRISFLLLAGKTEEATQYLQQALNISHEEAEKLIAESRMPSDPPLTAHQRATVARNGRRFILIIAGIGLMLFAVAAYLIVNDYQFSQQALHVQGEVIEYHEYETYSEEDGTSKSYSPVFRYELNGHSFTQRGRGSSSSSYGLGEKVDILIDPANPEIVLVNTFRERWFIPVILIISGIIFTGFAWFMKRFGKPV